MYIYYTMFGNNVGVYGVHDSRLPGLDPTLTKSECVWIIPGTVSPADD